ncbi:hypothetical protein AB5I41_14970 [Sphingomonas sp. MMS24-JH45]
MTINWNGAVAASRSAGSSLASKPAPGDVSVDSRVALFVIGVEPEREISALQCVAHELRGTTTDPRRAMEFLESRQTVLEAEAGEDRRLIVAEVEIAQAS